MALVLDFIPFGIVEQKMDRRYVILNCQDERIDRILCEQKDGRAPDEYDKDMSLQIEDAEQVLSAFPQDGANRDQEDRGNAGVLEVDYCLESCQLIDLQTPDIFTVGRFSPTNTITSSRFLEAPTTFSSMLYPQTANDHPTSESLVSTYGFMSDDCFNTEAFQYTPYVQLLDTCSTVVPSPLLESESTFGFENHQQTLVDSDALKSAEFMKSGTTASGFLSQQGGATLESSQLMESGTTYGFGLVAGNLLSSEFAYDCNTVEVSQIMRMATTVDHVPDAQNCDDCNIIKSPQLMGAPTTYAHEFHSQTTDDLWALYSFGSHWMETRERCVPQEEIRDVCPKSGNISLRSYSQAHVHDIAFEDSSNVELTFMSDFNNLEFGHQMKVPSQPQVLFDNTAQKCFQFEEEETELQIPLPRQRTLNEFELHCVIEEAAFQVRSPQQLKLNDFELQVGHCMMEEAAFQAPLPEQQTFNKFGLQVDHCVMEEAVFQVPLPQQQTLDEFELQVDQCVMGVAPLQVSDYLEQTSGCSSSHTRELNELSFNTEGFRATLADEKESTAIHSRGCEPHGPREVFVTAPSSPQGVMEEVLEDDLCVFSDQLEESLSSVPAADDGNVTSLHNIRGIRHDATCSQSSTKVRAETMKVTGSRLVHTSQSLQLLRTWWENHPSNPYPNEREVYVMTKTTGLTHQQICDWFKNERSRKWKNDPKKKKPKRLPQRAIHIFRRWAYEHLSHPHPTAQQREHLAVEAGVKYVQVSNWFMNFRKRSKALIKKAKEEQLAMNRMRTLPQQEVSTT